MNTEYNRSSAGYPPSFNPFDEPREPPAEAPLTPRGGSSPTTQKKVVVKVSEGERDVCFEIRFPSDDNETRTPRTPHQATIFFDNTPIPLSPRAGTTIPPIGNTVKDASAAVFPPSGGGSASSSLSSLPTPSKPPLARTPSERDTRRDNRRGHLDPGLVASIRDLTGGKVGRPEIPTLKISKSTPPDSPEITSTPSGHKNESPRSTHGFFKKVGEKVGKLKRKKDKTEKKEKKDKVKFKSKSIKPPPRRLTKLGSAPDLYASKEDATVNKRKGSYNGAQLKESSGSISVDTGRRIGNLIKKHHSLDLYNSRKQYEEMAIGSESPRLYLTIFKRLEKRLKFEPFSSNFRDQVKEVIRNEIKGVEPFLEEVVQKMYMPSREISAVAPSLLFASSRFNRETLPKSILILEKKLSELMRKPFLTHNDLNSLIPFLVEASTLEINEKEKEKKEIKVPEPIKRELKLLLNDVANRPFIGRDEIQNLTSLLVRKINWRLEREEFIIKDLRPRIVKLTIFLIDSILKEKKRSLPTDYIMSRLYILAARPPSKDPKETLKKINALDKRSPPPLRRNTSPEASKVVKPTNLTTTHYSPMPLKPRHPLKEWPSLDSIPEEKIDDSEEEVAYSSCDDEDSIVGEFQETDSGEAQEGDLSHGAKRNDPSLTYENEEAVDGDDGKRDSLSNVEEPIEPSPNSPTKTPLRFNSDIKTLKQPFGEQKNKIIKDDREEEQKEGKGKEKELGSTENLLLQMKRILDKGHPHEEMSEALKFGSMDWAARFLEAINDLLSREWGKKFLRAALGVEESEGDKILSRIQKWLSPEGNVKISNLVETALNVALTHKVHRFSWVDEETKTVLRRADINRALFCATKGLLFESLNINKQPFIFNPPADDIKAWKKSFYEQLFKSLYINGMKTDASQEFISNEVKKFLSNEQAFGQDILGFVTPEFRGVYDATLRGLMPVFNSASFSLKGIPGIKVEFNIDSAKNFESIEERTYGIYRRSEGHLNELGEPLLLLYTTANTRCFETAEGEEKIILSLSVKRGEYSKNASEKELQTLSSQFSHVNPLEKIHLPLLLDSNILEVIATVDGEKRE